MISELEIRRKIFHMVITIIIVILIYFDVIDYKVCFTLTGMLLVLGLISKKVNVPIFSWFMSQTERRKNLKELPSKTAILAMTGMSLSLYLFSKDIAMASIMILALGDTIAPLVGQYGFLENPFNKKKYIEGTIAGIIVGGIGAMLFVGIYEAFLAAFAAMVIEGIELKMGGFKKIDDNLIIPLVAGGVIWLMRLIL